MFDESLNKDKKNSEFFDTEAQREFLSNHGEIVFNDWIPFEQMGEFYSSGDLTLSSPIFSSKGIVVVMIARNIRKVKSVLEK